MGVILVLTVIAAAWYGCWWLTSGWLYADLQREFPTLAEKDARGDWLQARGIGLTGPIGLFVALASVSRDHGRMRPGQEDWR